MTKGILGIIVGIVVMGFPMIFLDNIFLALAMWMFGAWLLQYSWDML